MIIHDLSKCELSYKNASYGGMAGSKEGIIFEGQEWMIKYPQNLSGLNGDVTSYSTSPLSEYIGSHIYGILGYDVHETILGTRNGKLVVGCKDFATNNKMLLEMRTIKNLYNKELSDISDYSQISSSKSHVSDVEEMLLHFDKNPVLVQVEGVKKRFFEQSIIDIFIGNNDRNSGNWGIVREAKKPDVLAPIYDNGASFNSKITDEKLLSIYNSSEFENNSTNIVMACGINGHSFSAKKFFKYFASEPMFTRSLIEITSLINDKFNDIRNMIYDIPENIMIENKEAIAVISEIRKKVYIAQMEKRYEKLLLPEYERIKSQGKNALSTDIINVEHTADKIESFIENGGLDQIDKDKSISKNNEI